MNRDERKERAAESALADPAKFVGAVAYTIMRRWRRDLLYSYPEDAIQFCELLKLEVLAGGIVGRDDLSRFAQRRIGEFADDYGFARVRDGRFDCRQDSVEVSFDDTVSYQNMSQKPNSASLGDRISFCRHARKSRVPDPGEITEQYICGTVARHLRGFRERRRLTMHGLAGRAGLGDRAVSDAEGLVGAPALTTVFALAHAMDLATDCLLSGEERDVSAADFAAFQAVYTARLKRILALTAPYPSVFIHKLTGHANFIYALEAGRVPQLRVIAYLCQALELWPWYLLRESR